LTSAPFAVVQNVEVEERLAADVEDGGLALDDAVRSCSSATDRRDRRQLGRTKPISG
jgi:hypothetical protein